MDDRRFDDLTKLVGRKASRRTVIRAAIAGAIASVFGGSIAEAALSPIKTRPRLCIQPGQPCGRPGIDPSRDCCYKCNSTTHKCCETIGYLCTKDTDCCVTASGIQPICRDPQAAGTDRRKACFLPGTLTPGAQCTQGTDCSSGNCVNGVCSACAVGTTVCGANCCVTSQCQVCVGGVCKSKCGPCQTCNGQGVCVNICDNCQKCVNNTCVPKCNAALCQTCDPATGVCSTCNGNKCQKCVNGQCVDKCTKCQNCDPATGVCSPKTCLNKCDACNPATGVCGPKTCGPCQQCNANTGICETICDICHTCQNNICVPKCPDPCRPCDPYTGICGQTICDGPCETCEGGLCVSTCNPDQCEQCNAASETCDDTCGPCTACDGQGACAPICGDCEICINGQCEPLCDPCSECEVTDGNVVCRRFRCPGACTICNPTTGQCEACSSATCTECNTEVGACVSTCGECESCVEGGCVSCFNQPCTGCSDDTDQCVSLCTDPCTTCDPASGQCIGPDPCGSACQTCYTIPDGAAVCIDTASIPGACLTCSGDDATITACGACEFCGPDGCVSCENLPCWSCSNGACINTCDACQFCSDGGLCTGYSCGPGQECDGFGGCVDTCATSADCGDCQVCINGLCTDCTACIDGVCLISPITPPAELFRITPIPTAYIQGEDFLAMHYTALADITAAVKAVDVTIPATPGPSSSTSGCEAGDFAGFPGGSIALIQRGACTFQLKAQNAAAAGAVGVIIFNEGNVPSREPLIGGSLIAPGITIPVVSASYALGVELHSLIASGLIVRINTAVVT